MVVKSPKARAMRADAQRSIDTLLEAAKTIFAKSGVDAPVREIASEAGVGVGTVYRHFPKRSDLIAAVFRREIDGCAAAASLLAVKHEPAAALESWLTRYAAFIGTKRGLAAALHSGDPTFDALPAYFEQTLGPALEVLVASAVTSGQIRPDIEPFDLLDAVRRLPPGESGQRMLALMIDGLRYGAPGHRAKRPKKT